MLTFQVFNNQIQIFVVSINWQLCTAISNKKIKTMLLRRF